MKAVPLSKKQLQTLLQNALEVELATIPPYLCALYSIPDGKNIPSSILIRGVVLEEMLHLVQVANLLNAVGGDPRVRPASTLHQYPGHLPYITRKFDVRLERFSPEGVRTFMKIELPDKEQAPLLPGERRPDTGFSTIGDLYHVIEVEMERLDAKGGLFSRDSEQLQRQITADQYYNGAGELIRVFDLDTAKRAIQEIVTQGEGTRDSFSDHQPIPFTHEEEPGHYYRFQEILLGREYENGDRPNRPTGKEFSVQWDGAAVYPMRKNPATRYYPDGSELQAKSLAFNGVYRALLDILDTAVCGQPKELSRSIAVMLELKQRAIELMRIPVASSREGDETAGPAFEYDLQPKAARRTARRK